MSTVVDKWERIAPLIVGDPTDVRYIKAVRYISKLEKDNYLIDVGCGQGRLLALLANLGFSKLTGVEISTRQIKRAKLRCPNCNFVRATAMRLPFKGEAFDVLFSTAVIEHTENPAVAISEIARITKLGGHIVITSDCYVHRFLFFFHKQPIDKAIFPSTLFRIFTKTGLELLHYDAWGNLCLSFARYVARRLSLRHITEKEKVSVKFEDKPRRTNLCAFLKCALLDENVFYLKK